jgi:hypothetical protein
MGIVLRSLSERRLPQQSYDSIRGTLQEITWYNYVITVPQPTDHPEKERELIFHPWRRGVAELDQSIPPRVEESLVGHAC